jgi:hypothetical protein
MKWKDWIDKLSKDGIYNSGERLTKNGAVLKGNKQQIIDGPYSESKEIIGGYISIKADGLRKRLKFLKDVLFLISTVMLK